MTATPTSELLHDRPGYTVRRTFVSDMNNAVYLITAKPSGEQLLIDAADELEALQQLIADGAADAAGAADAGGVDADGGSVAQPGDRLRWILTTHTHWDHTRATKALAEATGAQIAVGRDDAPTLREERGVAVDRELVGGEQIAIDGVALETVALRGHTPGSIAFVLSEERNGGAPGGERSPVLLFTGDSLFPGGVGNTGDDAGRFAQLFADVTERLFDRFDDDAMVYPGHGAATTLGAERPSLPEWRARGW